MCCQECDEIVRKKAEPRVRPDKEGRCGVDCFYKLFTRTHSGHGHWREAVSFIPGQTPVPGTRMVARDLDAHVLRSETSTAYIEHDCSLMGGGDWVGPGGHVLFPHLIDGGVPFHKSLHRRLKCEPHKLCLFKSHCRD